jgi:N-acetylglucosaminyldiphosphoundecaprenol N-acetyl-beta-D-mannosaminyltransferase
VDVLGVGVSTLTMAETVDRVICWAGEPQNPAGPRYVCASTVHGVMEAWRDPALRRILNQAAIITADGMPLVWLARANGHRRAERVYGPTLMLEICRASAVLELRHYFYGGVDGVARALAGGLETRFPGLVAAGWYCPPFRPLTEAEAADVARDINDAGADIVWVGLSTPKQERWISEMRRRLTAKVMLSVGAAFDFHTGRVKQAPPPLQQAGLEWAYRLVQEPRRLWRRYLHNNPMFVMLAMLQLAGLKKFGELDT